MDFFKTYYKTIKGMAIILGAVICFYSQMHSMEARLTDLLFDTNHITHNMIDAVDKHVIDRMTGIEWRLTKIETVLVMQGIMHPLLAHSSQTNSSEHTP